MGSNSDTWEVIVIIKHGGDNFRGKIKAGKLATKDFLESVIKSRYGDV